MLYFMQERMMKRLFTPVQLAKRAGIKPDTLYHHIYRGKLNALKIEGSWYITQDEAHRYMKERKVGFLRSIWPF